MIFTKDQEITSMENMVFVTNDVLNQNLSATRTISATSIRDEENTVLRRYVMFSLTYKLEKFAGKKKENNMFMMD